MTDPDFDMDERPEKKATLADLIEQGKGGIIQYIYDFGDSWEHILVIGDNTDPVIGEIHPKLIGVKGNCPPEDIGGFPGYEYFLEAMADPDHPEHDGLKDWYGGDFDPHTPETDELVFACHEAGKTLAVKEAGKLIVENSRQLVD